MKWRAFCRMPQWVRLSEWLGCTRIVALPAPWASIRVIYHEAHCHSAAFAFPIECGGHSLFIGYQRRPTNRARSFPNHKLSREVAVRTLHAYRNIAQVFTPMAVVPFVASTLIVVPGLRITVLPLLASSPIEVLTFSDLPLIFPLISVNGTPCLAASSCI